MAYNFGSFGENRVYGMLPEAGPGSVGMLLRRVPCGLRRRSKDRRVGPQGF